MAFFQRVDQRDSSAEQIRRDMGALKGRHKANDDVWRQCNSMVVGDPHRVNPDGTSKAFDDDILRSVKFVIKKSPLKRFSSDRLRKKMDKTASVGKDSEKDNAFKEQCRKELIELCLDDGEKMIGVVSDLVSQVPFNPMFHALIELCREKLGKVVSCQVE